MRLKTGGLLSGIILYVGFGVTSGLAQAPMDACVSGQILEQFLGSDGAMLPSDNPDAQGEDTGQLFCVLELPQHEDNSADDVRHVAVAQGGSGGCGTRSK